MIHDIVIRRAESESDLRVVRGLWREYWSSLGFTDDFQGFGQELEGLPGPYRPPDGVLLVAWEGEVPAGTIALRRLNHVSGEVKRLYLRTSFRGRRLGQRLLDAVTERAIEIRYDSLFADTLPSMVEALSLYKKAGFVLVDPYSSSPTPGAIYLKKQLVRPEVARAGDAL
jgi:putative acetyltransferase